MIRIYYIGKHLVIREMQDYLVAEKEAQKSSIPV